MCNACMRVRCGAAEHAGVRLWSCAFSFSLRSAWRHACSSSLACPPPRTHDVNQLFCLVVDMHCRLQHYLLLMLYVTNLVEMMLIVALLGPVLLISCKWCLRHMLICHMSWLFPFGESCTTSRMHSASRTHMHGSGGRVLLDVHKGCT